jgi:urea transport system permease protein
VRATLALLGLDLGELVDALSAVLFLAVMSLGLYVIFGMMRVINLAHGELLMVGAYVVWWLDDHGVSSWAGLVAAPLLVGALGVLLERSVIRFLYEREDLSTLLATAGVSILLQRAVSLGIGTQPREVAAPIGGNVSILGQTFLIYQLMAMGLAVLVIAAVLWLFRRTAFGTRARATIERPAMAEAMGIDTGRQSMIAFALGAALAGFAGALIAPLVSVVPTMGADFVVQSFLVVIVGGTTELAGALGGSALIGGTRSLLTANLNATVAQMIVLALAMIIVVVRPQGLFRRS